MGFDLYGIEPVNGQFIPKEPDWELAKQKDREKYWDACDEHDIKYPGRYFRNNVWYWRPLWLFICSEVAPDTLSEEDKDHGHYNDFYPIDKDKAIYIADKIDELDEAGVLDEYEINWEKNKEETEDEPCTHCDESNKKFEDRASLQSDLLGCHVCNGTGMVRPFDTNYIFEASNVREFGKFARGSGGFTIG